jgi:hypothetical protein
MCQLVTAKDTWVFENFVVHMLRIYDLAKALFLLAAINTVLKSFGNAITCWVLRLGTEKQ